MRRKGGNMKRNNNKKVSSISKGGTIDEIAEFWDTHSLADYWEDTYEVDFEVRAKRRRRITLEPSIYEQVLLQAQVRGVLPETLVNIWLSERLQQVK
jgi:hypothetical protein